MLGARSETTLNEVFVEPSIGPHLLHRSCMSLGGACRPPVPSRLAAGSTQQVPGRLSCLAAIALPVLGLGRGAFWIACSGSPLPAGTQPSAGCYCTPLSSGQFSITCALLDTNNLPDMLPNMLRDQCPAGRHVGGSGTFIAVYTLEALRPCRPTPAPQKPCTLSRCTRAATVRRAPECLQKDPACKEALLQRGWPPCSRSSSAL